MEIFIFKTSVLDAWMYTSYVMVAILNFYLVAILNFSLVAILTFSNF